jgi:hypothetical protein
VVSTSGKYLIIELGPAIIVIYGITSGDDDFKLFGDCHGKTALAAAATATIDYLMGNALRRRRRPQPAVEDIVVKQGIIAVVKDHGPTLDHVTFDIDAYDLAIEQAPYASMSEPHLSPFPTTHVLDTSLLRTISGTGRGSDLYQTFIGYIRLKHRDLYLNCDVAKELTEQRGYMSLGWIDRVDTTG